MKRTLLIILPFIIILGLAGWYIISKKSGPQGGPEGSSSSGGFFGSLFPSSGGNNGAPDNTGSGGAQGGNLQNQPGGNALSGNGLRQLTTTPVAGFMGTTTQDGYVIRYVDRTTGNVFEISNTGSKRLTNTTIPAVYEALWSSDGGTVALRYLTEDDVIKTYIGHVVLSASSTATAVIGSLEGDYLVDDIPYMTRNADDSALIYLVPAGTGVTVHQSPFDASKDKVLFNSPFSEWMLSTSLDGSVTATTRASGNADGFAYAVSKGGTFSKLLGPLRGLTTLVSPSGTAVLYSESDDNGVSTRLSDMENRLTLNLSINTLPEKCAWSLYDTAMLYCGVPKKFDDGTYPDAWYQGNVSFDDNIWEINTGTNEVRTIASPPANTPADVTKPMVSADGSTLYFINKKDSTLWSLALPAPMNSKEGTTTPDSTSL